jgi:hypothetical protein
MSWLFSQALVEEYLGDISLDGEQSVPLNGNNIQQAYCAPGKMTKFSRLSRFGMMYKPLTESLGEELLMSYLEDFHAKTSLPQEKVQELKVQEVQCGDIWQESLGKLDPSTHLWKTAQCSLLEDLEQSLQTFPRWGSMRNGECFQRPILAQITLENEFGLLPRIPNNVNFFHTPTTGQDGGSNSRKALKKRMGMWPTPTVGCVEGGEQSNRVERTLGGGVHFEKTKQTQYDLWRKTFGCSFIRGKTETNSQWWEIEPKLDRVVDGMANRVDRIKAIGNGQVPLCAATAWKLLNERL